MSRVLGIVYRVIATHFIARDGMYAGFAGAKTGDQKACHTHKMAHTGAVTLIQRFGSALKRSQGAIFNSRRLAPVGVKGRDSPE
jgi:hypothetical protein